ncbi:MAG TPA: toll/interleukin-1 receptor domain-containing protein, partial [Ktedonobacterales bacterium]|nr:toll/interleukin-1 receptor domain-containing protein [Ktedonobacterales bacterium]
PPYSAPPPAPSVPPPGGAPPDIVGGLPPGYLDQLGGAAGDQPREKRESGQRGVPRLRPVQTLQFTAYHAGATPVEAPQTLLVYSHIAEQAGKVRSDAGTFTELGSMPQVAKGVSLRKVPRNIEITVEPHVEGVTFSPPRDRFIWEGEWRRSLFRYTGARELAGTTRTGWIDIYAGRVSPICTITVSLSFLGITSVASLSVPHGINVTSNVFDTVFISYSHRDREPMRQARETYESLGVTAYHDDLLEAGDNFEQRLAQMIRAASVFHLLWSDSAAQSPNVRKEWLLALQTRNDARFIRPWYWQQPLALPPDELRARKISFRYEHLRRRLLRPSTWR